MNRITKQLMTSAMLGAGLIGLARPDSVQADVVTSFYTNSSSYGYEIYHMPDLDQKRANLDGGFGLPGSGAMYCVPTSTMNLIMYAANHGFPSVDPFPNLWQLQSQYNLAGLELLDLGNNHMGTSPTDGTNGNQWMNGTKSWLDPHGFFTISQYTASGSYSPRTHGITQTAVSGALVAFAYGRFDVLGTLHGRPWVMRDGGHCVTLSKTNDGFGNNVIYVRDPADDPDSAGGLSFLSTQSPFGNRKLDADDVNFQYGVLASQWRTMTALNYNPAASRVSLIDQYIAIAPKSGYSFTNGPTFNFHFSNPYKMLGSKIPTSEIISLDGISDIMDMVIHPDHYWQVILTEDPAGGPPKLGPARRNTSQLKDSPVVDAEKIFFGRNRKLYLLSPTQLYCIDFDDDAWPIEASAILPGVGPHDALTYDDLTDEVIVLSIAEQSLLMYPSTLPVGSPPTVLNLPGTVLMAGEASIACSPMEPGTFWIASEGSNSIYGVSSSPLARGVSVEEVTFPSITDPTSVDFDDAGNMYVVSNGAVIQLMRNKAGDGWDEASADDAPFGGAVVGTMFRVTRSRTNHVDTEHEGPIWRNLDPDTETLETGEFEEDCTGDTDGNRVVDVEDLLDLLGGWGPCDICLSDFNQDRLIDVEDLLDLLAGWGDCP
ncbi:MAG: hypothetical protein O7G85_13930 [Planctomycetota bacterium]|nr:hypothetical protein [Planctomycetota bacterium]